MAILNLSIESQNVILNKFKDLLDEEKKPAYLEIHEGSMPTRADEKCSKETKLGTVYFTYPSAEYTTSGAILFSFEKNQIATKSGKATWGRVFTNSGKVLFDIDVSTKDKDAVLILNSTDIIQDGVILIKKLVFMLH